MVNKRERLGTGAGIGATTILNARANEVSAAFRVVVDVTKKDSVAFLIITEEDGCFRRPYTLSTTEVKRSNCECRSDCNSPEFLHSWLSGPWVYERNHYGRDTASAKWCQCRAKTAHIRRLKTTHSEGDGPSVRRGLLSGSPLRLG